MESGEVPQNNLSPIGSAVLTYIGYTQTDRHPDKQRIYIYDTVITSKKQNEIRLCSIYLIKTKSLTVTDYKYCSDASIFK